MRCITVQYNRSCHSHSVSHASPEVNSCLIV